MLKSEKLTFPRSESRETHERSVRETNVSCYTTFTNQYETRNRVTSKSSENLSLSLQKSRRLQERETEIAINSSDKRDTVYTLSLSLSLTEISRDLNAQNLRGHAMFNKKGNRSSSRKACSLRRTS